MKHKTVTANNAAAFDEECNKLIADGWVSAGNLVIASCSNNGEITVIYAQQWMK